MIYVRSPPSIAGGVRARGHVAFTGPAAPGFALAETPGEIEAGRGPVWLRPQECGGPVSPFTALVLIRAAARVGRPWVCEGLSLRGAAAALAVGATGVVVDTPLWACPESVAPAELLERLDGATTADSTVTGELDGSLVRRLARGPASFDAPQTVADALPGRGRPALEVLDAWVDALRERVAAARRPVRRELVCGPMANVTEGPAFAAALAAAGVTPFLALGALEPDRVRELLSAWGALGVPFGAGLIGFDVMPHRDAHLRALRESAPRPVAVTIAGGSAALAAALRTDGLDAWLHTPSARTAEAALDAGVDTVVFEGHEAGGHVGRTTSVGLWEDGLAALEARPDRRVVLAGGIGDPVSAAFATAMAAPFVHAGGRLVLQAGTAFLLTHEAAECGAVTPTYQSEALRADRTVLVGSSVNLPLRCVPNAFTDAARSEEVALAAAGVPRAERRLRLEHRNLGRTRLAAKGIERAPEWVPGSAGPRYRSVPTPRQRAEAAFTVGQGAVVTGRLSTVAGIARALGAEADALLAGRPDRAPFPPVSRRAGAPTEAPRRPARATEGARDGDVAIVGLGCVLPGALDVPSYWRNLVEGRSAIGVIPPERWSEARYHDPSAGSSGPTLSYARHAAVVRGFRFDPLAFRIPPRLVPTLDPSQRMALVAAAEAVRSAGWDRGPFDRARAAVVLGNSMGGEFAKSMALRIRFREVLDAVARDPLAEGWSVAEVRALEARVEERLAPRLPPVEVDSMAGLLGNVVAGRVAAWLDWMGGNLTVDAACAASLASVAIAVDWLRNGRCDAVLAGGVDTDLSPESYVGFCRTEALSRTGSHPFSSRADGFVMGEGAAVLALMRRADAERSGRRILAVIRAVGQSSDGRGRGITAPRAEGQDLAIGRAWAEAGLSPADVGLVEAHGTGTAVGDETEVGVLARRFADASTPTWLGSVKSMIGHLKGGAGAAALVKATLALASGVVPPTLQAGPVHPDLPLVDGPLRLPRTAVPLPRGAATVSAFGFGGTNFHVVLGRGGPDPHPEITASMAVGGGPGLERAWGRRDVVRTLVAWGAPTREELRRAVSTGRTCAVEDAAAAPARVVALATPGEDPGPRALRVLDGGRDPLVWRGEGPPLPVHLLFPGQGVDQADDAATRHLPAALAVLGPLRARIESDLGRGFSELLSAVADGDVVAIHAVGFALGVAHAAAFARAGVPVAAVLGHSLGGIPAAVAAGAWTEAEAWPVIRARGEALAACPEGRMVAVRGGAGPLPTGLSLAAVNADDQEVVCGPVEAVEAFARSLGPARARLLSVRRAFHGPSVAPAAEALARALAEAPAPAPTTARVVSARTGRDTVELREDLADAVVAPVRFRDALAALGPGLCVDVGPGDVVATLASRAGSPAVALAGADGPARVAAALVAAGHARFALDLPATAVDLALPAAGAVAIPAEPPPRPAPVPVEPEPEPAAGDVRAGVVAAICEITGYPPDWVTEGADLEADLGVDSIRKMEILGALEKRFGFATPESEYAALQAADLGSLVAHVERHLAPAPAAPAPTAATSEAWLALPAVQPRSPPGPDLDVAGAVAKVRAAAAARPTGPVSVTLRTDPAGLAAAAWLRSFARETGRTVDHGSPATVRWSPFAPAADRELPTGMVILATGGLRGILGPCLRSLADHAPRVVLLHRPGSPVDPAALPFPVLGVAGDVGDPDDVRRAVGAALGAFGRLDLVVHAAGALRDGPWDAATDEDLAAVLRPKWDGARNLVEATLDVPLRLFVGFSSLVAHLGNASQAVYAAANAAMETVRHPTAPTVHLAWTAWGEVGMAADPALGRLLRARGIVPLSPAAGAAAFRAVVRSRVEGTVAIAAQPLPDAEPPAWPLGAIAWRTPDATALHLPLDPAEPWLSDHRVGERPLVPAACWVLALIGAARTALGGEHALEELEVVLPTFVERPRTDVRVTVHHGPGPVRAEVSAGGAVVARARLRAARPAADEPAPRPVDGDDAGGLYRPDLLFHGPSWRVLDRWWSDADGFGADLRPGAVPSPLAAAIDGVHQALGAWGDREAGWLGLPVGAGRWEVAEGVPVRLEGTARVEGRALVADVVALDAAGRVVLRASGVRARAARGAEVADG